jgi:hypothetical protein
MYMTWSGRSSVEQQQPTKPPLATAASSSHGVSTPTPSYNATLPPTRGVTADTHPQKLLPHDAVLSRIYAGTNTTEHHQHTASIAQSSLLQDPNTATTAATRSPAPLAADSPHFPSSPQLNPNIDEGGTAGDLATQGRGEPASAGTGAAVAAAEAIFDGLFPGDDSVDEPGIPSSSSSSMGAAQRLLWAHLERVLELQTDLAGMHMQMEGIGTGLNHGPSTRTQHRHQRDGKSSKLRGDRSMSMNGGSAELDELAGDDDDDNDNDAVDEARKQKWEDVAGSNKKKNVDAMGGDGDDDGGEGIGAAPASDLKQEFSNLANTFTGRKKTIDAIMSKVSTCIYVFLYFIAPSFHFVRPLPFFARLSLAPYSFYS